MDSHAGVPPPPKGENKINAEDRVRLTEPRKSRVTEYKPNREGPGEDPRNRADRERECGARGMSLKYFVERKTGRL